MGCKRGQVVGRAGIREDFLEKGAVKSAKDVTGEVVRAGWEQGCVWFQSLGSV